MNRFLVLLACVLLAASPLVANAQASAWVDARAVSVEKINEQVAAARSRPQNEDDLINWYAGLLGIGATDQFKIATQYADRAGQNYRLQQYHLGLEVFNSRVVVNEAVDGRVLSLAGRFARGIDLDVPTVKPQVSPQRAIEIAKADYESSNPDSARFSNEDSRLVIAFENDRFLLAFLIWMDGWNMNELVPIRPTLLVDATSGEVVKSWDSLRRVSATGPGGNERVGRYEYGVEFPALEVTHLRSQGHIQLCQLENSEVIVKKRNGPNVSSPHRFMCPVNDGEELNGAYAPTNDVYFFSQVVRDTFLAYVDELPVVGKSISNVNTNINHRDEWVENYSGAHWKNGEAYFGVGGGEISFPPTSLDIVAHEFGHGFSARYMGSEAGYHPELPSAAIEEAFSDMSAMAAEFFLRGEASFVVGDEVVKVGVGRRLDEPVVPHFDDYSPDMDPHTASGFYSRAFYLLSNTPGWGIPSAFRVFADANRKFWHVHMSFEGGACGVEMAASQLGLSSADVKSVFSQVGVHCGAIWDKPSALASRFGGPLPILPPPFTTISTGVQPSDGYYGFFARTNKFHDSGKRYVEVSFPRHQTTQLWGEMVLLLRTEDAWPFWRDGWGLFWVMQDDTSPEGFPFSGMTAAQGWHSFEGTVMEDWRVTEGDTIGVAVDFDAGRIWYSLNGIWAGNPEQGIEAVYDEDVISPGSGLKTERWGLFFETNFADISIRLRGSDTEFLYERPEGFLAWGEE